MDSSGTSDKDTVEYEGIKYSKTRCLLRGEHGQNIFKGSFTDRSNALASQEREVAVICFKQQAGADTATTDFEPNGSADTATTGEDKSTYINQHYDRVIPREIEAHKARDEYAHKNVHKYYAAREDKDSKTMYIAAEPFMCTLAHLVDSVYLSNPKNFRKKIDGNQTMFTDRQGRFTVKHLGNEISYTWNEDQFTDNRQNRAEEKRLSFTISKKEIIRQIVEGLAFLHSRGIIHRNVTPESIFIAYDKETEQVLLKLSGFCLSKKARKDMSTSNTGSKAVGWSPWEMLDPEVKSITLSVDIFSLGCVMYHVLTLGDHPFKKDEENIRRNISRPLKHMEFSNEWFLIKRMISFNPKERPNIEDVKRSPALLDKDHYVIYHSGNKPGVCLIFNQENFLERDDLRRVGSSLDAENLYATFSLFGFDCHVYPDLTKEEICKEVITWSKKSEYQSIVVCVLSHGNSNSFFGFDHEPVTYKNFRDIFRDPSPNKDGNYFNGKPKIFIYQSCRGDRNQVDVKRNVPCINLPKSCATVNATADGEYSQPHNSATAIFEPELADVLEIYSTMDGYKAYLTEEGSPFIQILCRRLKEMGDSEDFLSVLQLNDELKSWKSKNEKKVVVENKEYVEQSICKQLSVMETSLSKCLRLQKVDAANLPAIKSGAEN